MVVTCATPVYPIRYEYITPEGTVYPLDVPRYRSVINAEGEGLPPINYISQRGPFQHGNTVLDYFLQPRIVQLTIRHQFDNRYDLERGRETLVGTLNPGLQLTPTSLDEGILRKQLSDGSLRNLKCFIIQGPNFNPRGPGWDEYAFNEVLRFQASDPVWYDPTLRTQVFDWTTRTQLVGPITGPIQSSAVLLAGNVNYTGWWISYPTITLNGPMSGVTITNTTTGDTIVLNYPIPAARYATIALTPGSKSVTLDDGTNLLGFITDDSDITTWALTPANGGVNAIQVYAAGTNVDSDVTMTWYDKYLGV